MNLGLLPGFGGWVRLPRRVPPGIAKELIYTGRTVSTEEALRIGLANQVFETTADALTHEKRGFRRAVEHSEKQEGVRAFLEKRPAHFF